MRIARHHLPPKPVTRGPRHHFFGYYDKTPWDATGRYLLGLEAGFAERPPGPADAATIGLIDTAEGFAWRPLAQTRAWNWQQGCMLQWHPGEPDRLVIYNARQGERPVGVVMDAFTRKDRLLPLPVYAVSPRGDVAISLSFARLADVRPGYGYYGLDDPWGDEAAPAHDGLHHVDLETGEARLALTLAELAAFRPLPTMEGAKHWVNHVQFSTDGSRIGMLHRWRGPAAGRGWQTRLLTAAPDGSELRCLSDHGKVSHYDWRDPEHVLAWARREGRGEGYFLFADAEGAEPEPVGQDVLTGDGHCSYCPDRRWILTDACPDESRRRTLILFNAQWGWRVDVGRFRSPPELAGEVRCDLHPRWSRDGRRVCFDSAHEGSRQLYVMDVSELVAPWPTWRPP